MPVIFFNGKFQEGEMHEIPRESQVPAYLEKPLDFSTYEGIPDPQYYPTGSIFLNTKTNQFHVMSKVIDSEKHTFKFWSVIPYNYQIS